MMNIGVGGGHEYGDEMLTEMPGWGDELMRKTDHKVANDYSGKEKRHTDFWGNPPEQIVNILWNIKLGIFLWKSKTPTCNPTSTLSTPHRGRGRRSWSCAWSRWSSILASFSEGTAPHCLKKVKLWKWKYSFKNASISGGTAPYCLETWKWKDCFKVASFSEGIKKIHCGIIFWGKQSTLSEKVSWFPRALSPQEFVTHCVIKNSSLRIHLKPV